MSGPGTKLNTLELEVPVRVEGGRIDGARVDGALVEGALVEGARAEDGRLPSIMVKVEFNPMGSCK